MNNLCSVASILKRTRTAAPVVDPPSPPTNLFVISSTNSAVLLGFTAPTNFGEGASGITSYTVSAQINGTGPVSTETGPSSPVTLTGLQAGQKYVLTVAAKNNGNQQSPPSQTISTWTLHPLMVSTIIHTESGTLNFTAHGNTTVSASTKTTNSGTNFIDRAFGLEINVATSEKRTYLSLASMNKTAFRVNATFYLKFQYMANTHSNDRAFTFAKSFGGGSEDFCNVSLNTDGQKAQNWQIAYNDPGGNSRINGNKGTIPVKTFPSVIYHVFMTFNSNNTKQILIFADKSKTDISGGGNSTTAVTAAATFEAFVYFGIGKSKYSDLECSRIKVYYANLLPFCASLTEMQDFAFGDAFP